MPIINAEDFDTADEVVTEIQRLLSQHPRIALCFQGMLVAVITPPEGNV